MRGDDYLESERVNSLSPQAERFYFRLLCAVDAHGKLDARHALLRTKLYALQLDRAREADLSRLLQECEQAGLVRSYSVNGKPYLIVHNFRQRLRTASKYPDPPALAHDGHMPDTCPRMSDSCSPYADTCQTHDGQLSDTCPHEEEYDIEEEEEYEKEEERGNIMQRSIEQHANPDTPTLFKSPREREAYKRWLPLIKNAHPAGRERATMEHKLHVIAISAFRSSPSAHQQASLIRAFYDSSIDVSTKGRPFKKPMEFRWYLTDLPDVIVSARQWAKETRWKPAGEQRAPKRIPQEQEHRDLATEEDKAAFLSEFRDVIQGISE